jgi:Bor protein
MSRALKLLAAAMLVTLPACYHATIETGLPPSPKVIDKGFASGWIYGLVPPSPVKAMSECPNGVSKVETQLSFVNQLVNFLTLGIYTPMSIKVTCASSGRSAAPVTPEIKVGDGATSEEVIDAFRRAADLAVETHGPVYVQF